MWIVSRSTKERISGILKHNNMEDFFQVIIEKAQKPKAKFLKSAIQSLGIDNANVLYVGDDQEDIELGKNCDIDTIYCLRKNKNSLKSYREIKDWLATNKPTYQINNLTELLDII